MTLSPGSEADWMRSRNARAVEFVLQRYRDQLLDLAGGQAQRLGLDLDLRRVEFRQHVYRRMADPGYGDHEQHGRGGRQDRREPEA